jgi:hypothetical protein
LESYFKKYPDVSKETILKQHLLSLGHWFSDAALQAAAGALVKTNLRGAIFRASGCKISLDG